MKPVSHQRIPSPSRGAFGKPRRAASAPPAAARAHSEVAASEQCYRILAESLPQMVSIRDAAGRILYCNSSWLKYRGVAREEAADTVWSIGVPPEELATAKPPPWVTGIHHPFETETRLRRASDGALRWPVIRIMPVPPEPGSAARWMVISSDIHKRKQAEQDRERLLAQIERERVELAVQFMVTRVLADSTSLPNAAPRLFAVFCEHLGFQAGVLWFAGIAESSSNRLSLLHIRQQPGLEPPGEIARSQPGPLRKGQSLAGRVWAEGRPLSLPRLSPGRGAAHHRAAARLGLGAAFAFPILLAGEVRGVVELFSRERYEPGKQLLDIIGNIGIQLGLFTQRTHALERLRQSEEALIQVNNALERRVSARTAELHEANRELSAEIAERTRLEREIIRISEREQRRIGQDLHDGICQELAAIAFMLRALAARLSRAGSGETQRIDDVAHLLNDCISRCRDIARGLHPVEMDADGLAVALNELAQRTSQTIACTFECNEPILMPESDTALNLYRIAQESVTNALKYSHAKLIAIRLDRDGPGLRLSIADDGLGIPAPAATPRGKRGSMGLHIIRYRARAMGAAIRILTRQPHGTEVVCLLRRK
jgi:PAS domain S-box-containing protein